MNGQDRRTHFLLTVHTPDLPQAACKGHPKPLWDSQVDGETDGERDDRHRQAKEFCAGCPELMACLRVRRDDPDLPPGIWGGCLVGTPQGAHRTYSASPVRVDRRTA